MEMSSFLMRSWFRVVARECGAWCLLALVGSAPAVAQTLPAPPPMPTGQPSAGVFGGVGSRNDPGASSLIVSLAEAYDSNVLGDSVAAIQSPLQASGFYSELNASFTLRGGAQKLQFATAGGTDLRYYSQDHQVVGVGHYGNAGLTYLPSRTTTLVLDGGVTYTPSYLYSLFTSIAPPVVGPPNGGGAYAVTDDPMYRYDARVSLTEKLSSRSQLTFRTGGFYTDFVHKDVFIGGVPQRNLATFDAAGTFVHSVSRDLNLNVGYIYSRAEYFTGAFPAEHDITFGGDYTRMLSRTRRSHLKFNVGTAMLEATAPGDSLAVLRQQYRLAGDVTFSRQIARTWLAEGGYRRGFGFIEGLATPVLTDGVNVSGSGLLTRSVDLLVKGAYSVGEPVTFGATHGFTTYTTDVRTRFALKTAWAVYLEYLYYYYDFSGRLVPIGAPPKMARNSVRVGLTWWFPLQRS